MKLQREKNMSLSKTTQKEFIQNKDEFKAPIELLELINLMANKMSAQQWSLFTHKLETENELGPTGTLATKFPEFSNH